MTGSLFHSLLGILSLAGNSAPAIGGVLLSFLFMGVIVVRTIFFPLLNLIPKAKPQRLRRQGGEVALLIALSSAGWLVPLHAIIDPPPLPFVSVAALTLVITVVAFAKLIRLVASVASLAFGHTAAAIIPERKPAPDVADYREVPAHVTHAGPVQSALGPSQRIEAGLKSGTLLQWAPWLQG